MKLLSYITISLLLVLPAINAYSQDRDYTGPASIEYNQITHKKPDQTGGMQKAGGLNLPINLNMGGVNFSTTRKDLDPYRGPDVLNSCAYFSSSLVDNQADKSVCCAIEQQLKDQGKTNQLSLCGSSSSSSSSGGGGDCSAQQKADGCIWKSGGQACICPVCLNSQKAVGCADWTNPQTGAVVCMCDECSKGTAGWTRDNTGTCNPPPVILTCAANEVKVNGQCCQPCVFIDDAVDSNGYINPLQICADSTMTSYRYACFGYYPDYNPPSTCQDWDYDCQQNQPAQRCQKARTCNKSDSSCWPNFHCHAPGTVSTSGGGGVE